METRLKRPLARRANNEKDLLGHENTQQFRS